MLRQWFLEHPASVNESYFQHLLVAASFAGTLLFAGIVCLVHGLVPCLFSKTASRLIERLHDRMVTHRVRHQG